MSYTQARHGREQQNSMEAACAWASFSCACIRLYVPDSAFDPAMESRLRLEIYNFQRNDLKSQLNAWQSFRTSLNGVSNASLTRKVGSGFARTGKTGMQSPYRLVPEDHLSTVSTVKQLIHRFASWAPIGFKFGGSESLSPAPSEKFATSVEHGG